MSENVANHESLWPHRWAVALVCATFPLLWVGGLVTTTDAGMAVPDWPSTYGYNLFLYPWTTWLAAPWDLFVEHGHRLLGATVGIMTIALVALIWRGDSRRWMRWLSIAALALVCFQGALGGMRVLFDERTLAMLHGCTGPLFFALATSIAVFTGKQWRSGKATITCDCATTIRGLAVVTCILVYLQLVVGAVLRHVPVAAEPTTFALAVRFHLFLAGIVTLHIMLLASMVFVHAHDATRVLRLTACLLALVAVQLALGAGTWIVKFSVPAWASSIISPSAAVQEGGWLQTHIITAHVAVGSLLLVTSLANALYAQMLIARPLPAEDTVSHRLEAAV